VASIGITQVMAKRNGDPGISGEADTVFVAMKDIALGDILTSQALRLEQWPKDKVPAGALTRIEDVEGRRARTKLYAGEPILENKLSRKGANDNWASAQIPKGFRVLSVKVDQVSGGASLILPGDRVDVLVYLIRDPQKGIQETTTRTVLQDIRVFAVNDVVGMESDKDSKSMAAKTISLLVTPDQAAKLTLATEMGKIRLVMRPPDDEQTAQSEAHPYQLLGKTDRGDRNKEEPGDKPAAGPKGMGQNFLDLLNAARAKPVAPKPQETVASGPSVTWTMRILQPGAVSDIVLESETDPTNVLLPGPYWKWHVANSAGSLSVGPQRTKPEPPAARASPKPDASNPEPQPNEPEPSPDQPST
jgi:pilus assembly protein CpaB